MGRLNVKVLGLAWAGFTVLFVVLQFVVNDGVNGFAVLLSALGAVPVATLIAWRARDRTGP